MSHYYANIFARKTFEVGDRSSKNAIWCYTVLTMTCMQRVFDRATPDSPSLGETREREGMREREMEKEGTGERERRKQRRCKPGHNTEHTQTLTEV